MLHQERLEEPRGSLKDQKILNVNVYHNYLYGVTNITVLRMKKIICCAAVTDTKVLPSGIS